MNELYSIGLRPAFFVPLIIIAALSLIAVVLLRIGKAVKRRTKEGSNVYVSSLEGDGWLIPGYTLACCAAIMVIVASVMFIPYQWKYAQMYRVSGEVTRVSNVLQDASGQLTSAPVVELDALPVPVEVENQRAVGLEGKDVTLTCTLNWRYAAADRLVCDLFEVTGDE